VSVDTITLAEALNRNCHCITVDKNKLIRALESSPITAGVYASILRDRPNLFSASPVFLARVHLDRMQAVIRAVERVVQSEPFRAWALALAPDIAHLDHGPRGVFLGYDFHLGHEGPQLIEINTNAGGGLLNASLARAQEACCSEVAAQLRGAHVDAVEEHFVTMFHEEWRRQRRGAPLRSIAIVDDRPEHQYLYPEFRLFQELFHRAGLAAWIVDRRALTHHEGALRADGQPVDLVYNRLTDFFLRDADSAALHAAYEAGDVVVTPNPHVYALYADKRHLTVLSDAARLRAWGIPPDVVDELTASVPPTRLVDSTGRDELWRARRDYFFKPVDGYGGKAAYRGDKLTRGAWATTEQRPYVAQQLVPPSQRTVQVDGREVPLKLDVRNYVYDGQVQLVAARLYEGQLTNFRTTGGGFAPVFTEVDVRSLVGPGGDCGTRDEDRS